MTIPFDKLLEPFRPADIEWRLQTAGEKNGQIWARVLAYITNRAIMARLDEVCGPANWKNEFAPAPCGGIMCGISLRIDGEWVTKWDGAENTDIEAVKGGLSNAMKRAAVQWGIGRYLYDLEEDFAIVADRGKYFGKTKDNKQFRWSPPELPPWALPPVRYNTPPNAAAALRKLAERGTEAMRADVEAKIVAGLTLEEARKLQEDLKSMLSVGAT